MFRILLLVGFSLITLTAFAQPVITKRPIADHCSRPRKAGEDVSRIVVHFVSASAQSPENPYQLEAIVKIFETAGVSSHFIINRQGVITELVPTARVAYHAGKGKLKTTPSFENNLNAHAIGIELMAIGTEQEMTFFYPVATYRRVAKENIGFTEQQYQALNALIDELIKEYPAIQRDRSHIVGHQEYSPTRSDPGTLFDWSKIGL